MVEAEKRITIVIDKLPGRSKIEKLVIPDSFLEQQHEKQTEL